VRLLRIGAEGCEENDLTAPTLRNSTREHLFWLAIRRMAENENPVHSSSALESARSTRCDQ